ncbi:MAG: tetratricopeptide repeat protein [Candidatus Melainabacteria bacterium]
MSRLTLKTAPPLTRLLRPLLALSLILTVPAWGINPGWAHDAAAPEALLAPAELATANNTDESDPVLLRAAEFMRKGQGRQAKAIYEAYLEEQPRSLTAMLALARIAQREHDYATAQGYLEQALHLYPSNPVTSAEIGHLFLSWSQDPIRPQDFMARAAEHLRQASTLNPSDPLIQAYQGELALAQNDTIEAEHALRLALGNPAATPDIRRQAHETLGRLYTRLDQRMKAKSELMQALELDPTHPMTHYLIARLLADADHPAEAIQHALQSEQFDIGDMPARDLLLARQYEKLGELEKAAEAYKRVLVYDPYNAASLKSLGVLYNRLHQTEISQSYFSRAMVADPKALAQMTLEAQILLRSSSPENSRRLWEDLLAIDPGNPQAQNALAGLSYRQWRKDQGQQQLPGLSRPLPRSEADTADAKAPDSAGAAPLQTLDDSTPATGPLGGLTRLNAVKKTIAAQGFSIEVLSRLETLKQDPDPFLSGEAAYLLKEYGDAHTQLDAVDGKTIEEYALMADTLLLDGEITFARVYYQRALELLPITQIRPDPRIQQALEKGLMQLRIQENEAERHLQLGNTFYEQKNLTAAAREYETALAIYPEMETACLRLGDTYEKLRDKVRAYKAYQQAVALRPGLMDSEGFARKFRKLQKAAQKSAPLAASQPVIEPPETKKKRFWIF